MTLQSLAWMFMIPLLCLLLLVAVLAFLLRSSHKDQTQLMLHLLSQQTMENQSLRNQLRAQDPMTLHSLNSGTNVPLTSEQYEQYAQYPDGISYGEDLDPNAAYRTGEIDDDLAASGWSAPVTTDVGGTPVRLP